MSFGSKIKLFSKILLLALICGALVVYVNRSTATVPASHAEMQLQTYQVGSEFAGILTKQYVNTGDTVKTGKRLFELKSDTLRQQLASGQLKAKSLSYELTPEQNIILTATDDGIVTETSVPVGSFVMAGRPLATVVTTKTVTIKASFNLSERQYAKLNPNSPFVVILPGGKNVPGVIRSVTQTSSDGQTLTIITAALSSVPSDKAFLNNGLSVNARLTLDTNTMYDRIINAANSVR